MAKNNFRIYTDKTDQVDFLRALIGPEISQSAMGDYLLGLGIDAHLNQPGREAIKAEWEKTFLGEGGSNAQESAD